LLEIGEEKRREEKRRLSGQDLLVHKLAAMQEDFAVGGVGVDVRAGDLFIFPRTTEPGWTSAAALVVGPHKFYHPL